MPMTQVPSYIGDDAFKAFLSEHDCRTSFEEIRMRFLGAMVSPGRDVFAGFCGFRAMDD